jgi:hypothetical protein
MALLVGCTRLPPPRGAPFRALAPSRGRGERHPLKVAPFHGCQAYLLAFPHGLIALDVASSPPHLAVRVRFVGVGPPSKGRRASLRRACPPLSRPARSWRPPDCCVCNQMCRRNTGGRFCAGACESNRSNASAAAGRARPRARPRERTRLRDCAVRGRLTICPCARRPVGWCATPPPRRHPLRLARTATSHHHLLHSSSRSEGNRALSSAFRTHCLAPA